MNSDSLLESVSSWDWPNPWLGAADVAGAAALSREALRAAFDENARADLELATLDWLYAFVRANVKRGRVFEVAEALRLRRADCLAYTLLLNGLGAAFALDIGVADIVIDNAGRHVPHTASLLRLANGRRQLVDLWHGAKDCNHRRLGLQVREGGGWHVADIEWAERARYQDVRGLPDQCAEGITLYIRGNRHLALGIEKEDRAELQQAVECYNAGIRLYPQNVRLYYNRAVVRDRLGDAAGAAADYAAALKYEAGRLRVFAREHEEITRLIYLDEFAVGETEQQVYLLRHGFVTGKTESLHDIAARLRLGPADVERIAADVEVLMARAHEA